MPPRVVILAGGKGTRLRPFTVSFPKPLVPLGDKPILEILLRRLAALGFRRVTLTVGHLASLIRAFIDQNKSLSALLDIDFVFEERATGTAGSLAQVEGLDEPFLVMNGDVLTDLDYRAMLAVHVRSGAMLTFASHRVTTKSDFGVIESDAQGRVADYLEKPVQSHEVSMGVYAYSPAVLELIAPGQYLDFPDLVKRLLREGRHVQLYRNDALWLDIGRPEDYAKAQEIYDAEPRRFDSSATPGAST